MTDERRQGRSQALWRSFYPRRSSIVALAALQTPRLPSLLSVDTFLRGVSLAVEASLLPLAEVLFCSVVITCGRRPFF